MNGRSAARRLRRQWRRSLRSRTIRFDADTLIALAVIWFLISDGEEFDTELILMIGILLVLGL